MSQINTNGIDAEYPTPGVNNSSQGFRDNFAQIKNNLDVAGDEIADLQNNAVLKAPLANSTLNNNMANTLISNAAIQNFRSTVFNLGSALSGRVIVDTSLADSFTGIIEGDTTLQFAKWAPDSTERSINLKLDFSNVDAVVQFPSEVVSSNNNYGTTLLENYKDSNGVASISKPAQSDIVEFTLTTLDCGETISINPTNRPFKSTQIIEREPSPMGLPGDTNGTIAIGSQKQQVAISETANLAVVITANTVTMNNSFITGNVLTVGNVASGNIQTGMLLSDAGNTILANTFIVDNISGSDDGSTWEVSQTQGTGNLTITGTTGIAGTTLTVGVETSGAVNDGMILSGSGITSNTRILSQLTGSGDGSTWLVDTEQYASPATINGAVDLLTCDSTEGLETEDGITFTGNVFGGVSTDTTYYIDSIVSSTEFTISDQPSGNMFALSDANGTMFANPDAYLYMCVDDFDGTLEEKTVVSVDEANNIININNTNNVDLNSPVFFVGDELTGTGIVPNQIYYVKTKDTPNGGDITVSAHRFNGVAGAALNIASTGNLNGVTMTYIDSGKDIWRRINLNAW